MMLSPGDQVERYVVEALLGRGAMAAVYRVRHRTLRTLHALKVLTLSSERVRDRLIQEGQVQAQLRHPNVLSVTDVLDVNGAPGLLMEFIDGPSLEGWLEDHSPDLVEAERIFRGIMAGMAEAHGQGLVHRDLKPANILCAMPPSGPIPKIADFGLAKVLAEEEGGGLHRTRSGSALGTPAYMAPEQIRDAKSVDSRADMFSLGAILYELVSGLRAFNGEDLLSVFNQVAQANYQPIPPGTPPRIERAIRGLLTVDRETRIGDCETLRLVLDEKVETWANSGAFVRKGAGMAAVISDAAAARASGPGASGPGNSAPGSGGGGASGSGAALAVPVMAPPTLPKPISSATMDLDAEDGPADSGTSMEKPAGTISPAGTMTPMASGTIAPVSSPGSGGMARVGSVVPTVGVPESPPAKSSRGMWLGVAGLGLVIGVVGVAAVFMGGGSGGSAVGTEQSSTAEPAQGATTDAAKPLEAARLPAEPPVVAPPVVQPPVAPPPVVTPPVEKAVEKPIEKVTAKQPPKAKDKVAAVQPEVSPAPRPAEPSGTGTLKISSTPFGTVTIDGAAVGNTGRPYTVSSGTHSVTIKTAAGQSKSTSLTVGAGESKGFCWDFDENDKCL